MTEPATVAPAASPSAAVSGDFAGRQPPALAGIERGDTVAVEIAVKPMQ